MALLWRLSVTIWRRLPLLLHTLLCDLPHRALFCQYILCHEQFEFVLLKGSNLSEARHTRTGYESESVGSGGLRNLGPEPNYTSDFPRN